MRATTRLAVITALALSVLHAGRAWGAFHIVVIDQVFLGTADCPSAQYVTMRMLVPQQRFIMGQKVATQNADGSAAADFGQFAANVPSGNMGDTFTIGTAAAAGLFGIAMDQVASGQLVLPDGRVCYGQFAGTPVDCVAYGNYTGDNGNDGMPAAAPGPGMALVRQTNTHNNKTDFAAAAPMPRNNAGTTGTLGQCPAGVATPTPTKGAATPTSTAGGPTPTPGGCVGDCNGTDSVEINELIIGVNIALGNAQLSTCPSFDADGSGMVGINELVTAVNNALNGCSAT